MAHEQIHTDSTGTATLTPTGTGWKLQQGGLTLDGTTPVAGTVKATAVNAATVTATSGFVGTLTGPELAEVVTATNVITAAESGTIFYLSAAAGFQSTLPAPALGLLFRFVVKTAPTTNGYTIVTTDSANIIFGMVEERVGGAGVAGAARDLITIVANQAIVADYLEVHSDGTNWYVHGQVDVSQAVTFGATG